MGLFNLFSPRLYNISVYTLYSYYLMSLLKYCLEFKNLKIKNILIFGFFVVFTFFQVKSSNFPLSLYVTPWEITYGISDTWLNFWSVTVSWAFQEIERQFEDYFWVQDLKAADSGYYTTVVSAGLVWPLMTITWIYMKADNINPELLLGVAWNVFINTGLLNYKSISGSVTYIYRDNALNFWKINKYGDKPWIKIVVPPFVSPWNYSWTIFFSLNEND